MLQNPCTLTEIQFNLCTVQVMSNVSRKNENN